MGKACEPVRMVLVHGRLLQKAVGLLRKRRDGYPVGLRDILEFLLIPGKNIPGGLRIQKDGWFPALQEAGSPQAAHQRRRCQKGDKAFLFHPQPGPLSLRFLPVW